MATSDFHKAVDNEWESVQQQLWHRATTTPLLPTDLDRYDKKIRAWVKELMTEQIRMLEVLINKEIERVCREQDERCITELCKILDEKFDDFLESFDDE